MNTLTNMALRTRRECVSLIKADIVITSLRQKIEESKIII